MPTLDFQMKNTDGSAYSIKLTGSSYSWDWVNGMEQCYLMVSEFDQVILGTIFLTNF